MPEAAPFKAGGKRAGSGSRPTQSIDPLRCCASSRREMKVMSRHCIGPLIMAAHDTAEEKAICARGVRGTAPAEGGGDAGARVLVRAAVPAHRQHLRLLAA